MRVVRLVYSYHLAIFFFVSGMQFRIEKYSGDPFLLLYKRVQTMWPGFFCYLTFFTLTHEIALNAGVLVGEDNYTTFDFLNRTINNFLFLGSETLGGAMWFIPVMLVALLLFGGVIWVCNKYIHKYRILAVIICVCTIGAVGVYCNLTSRSLTLHLHTALLLMPMMLAGAMISYYHTNYDKVFRIIPAVICFAFTSWITFGKGVLINLAAEQIGSALLFYPLSFCGIYSMCTLAKYLDRIKPISHALSFVGQHSFDIMALHFFIFKIIDLCYAKVVGIEDFGRFPYAFDNLWPVYTIASICIAPWIRVFIKKLYTDSKVLAKKYFG